MTTATTTAPSQLDAALEAQQLRTDSLLNKYRQGCRWEAARARLLRRTGRHDQAALAEALEARYRQQLAELIDTAPGGIEL